MKWSKNMNIVHQNKDVLFKALSHSFPETMNFLVGGTEEIKRQLPTQFPLVEAKQWQADMVYETINGNIVLIEYESYFHPETLQKYMNYCLRLIQRYPRKTIRMFVIHTGNNNKRKPTNKIGNLAIKYKNIHLCDIDSNKVYLDAKREIECGNDLNDTEEFFFTIYPLIDYKNRVRNLEKGLALLEKMRNPIQQNRILAGMLTASDKFINKEQIKKIKEKIDMTKFEELVLEEVKGPYEEKIAKIEMKAKKDRKAKIKAEKEIEEARKQAKKEIREAKKQAELANRNMIKLLLENGVSVELIKKANTINY